MKNIQMKYDAFISYRRDGGWALVRFLYDRLSREGYRIFFDIESMRSGKFDDQLYKSIDESASIIVILSPNALDNCADENDWVRKEISYALRQGKTLIPVMMQGFGFPASLPEDIRELTLFQGVQADSRVSADYWYEELKKYIDEQCGRPIRPCAANQCKEAEEEQIIRSNFVASSGFFTGREKEIASIHEALAAGSHYLFIHGYGGIGKSELAKRYAQTYRDHYSVVLFLRYKTSLQELLLSIPMENFTGKDDQRLIKLKSLIRTGMLLIIDNFDVPAEYEAELAWLFQSGADILITTRTDFSGVVDSSHILDLDSLPQTELREVFEHYSGIRITDREDEILFGKICEQVACHTYAVELLARHAAFSALTLAELAKNLEEGIMRFSRDEKVLTSKDDTVIRQSIPELIRVLFRLSSLSSEQQQVLRNLSFLNFMVMTKRIYKQAMNAQPKEMTALNDLIELGIVRIKTTEESEAELELHPLILETIRAELKPTLEKCKAVYDFILREIRGYDWPQNVEHIDFYLVEDAASIYEFRDHALFALQFFANADMTEDTAISLFNTWTCEHLGKPLVGSLENDYRDARLWQVPEMRYPYMDEYTEISEMLREKKEKTIGLLYAQLAVLHAWLRAGFGFIRGEKLDRRSMTRQAFDDCFSTALELTDDPVEPWAPAVVLQAVVIAEHAEHIRGLTEELYQFCNEYALHNLSVEIMDLYSIPHDQNGNPIIGKWHIIQEILSETKNTETDIPEKGEETEKYGNEYFVRFIRNDEDKIPVVREIMEDSGMSMEEKLILISKCFERYEFYDGWFLQYGRECPQKQEGIVRTSIDEVADYCNQMLDTYREELLRVPDCIMPFLRTKFVVIFTRLYTACLEKDRKKVQELLRDALYLFRWDYERICIRREDAGSGQEDGKPFRFQMMSRTWDFSRIIHRFGGFCRPDWTILAIIETLEIERRIPEHLSDDLQKKIDRILVHTFRDVINKIQASLACAEDDTGTVLTQEETERIKNYHDFLKRRLEEIIDRGYKIRKKKD